MSAVWIGAILMANPRAYENGKASRFRSGKEAAKNGSKGGKASGEARAFYKTLTEDLKERCTPERLAKMNDRLITMAEHGNLRAYELVRDGLGENPKNGVIDTEMLKHAKEILEGIDSAID